MLLQYEEVNNKNDLDEVELQHLGHQLVGVVSFYKQFIPITDDETLKRLNILEYIGKAIITRNYHLLINDPKVIKRISELTVNEYQQNLYESYADFRFAGKPF